MKTPPSPSPRTVLTWMVLGLTSLLAGPGCQPADPQSTARRPAATVTPVAYTAAIIGAASEGKPWITHVAWCDLDADGLLDGLACDAAKNTVIWLRQGPGQTFAESVLASDLTAPVHITPVDIDGDRDLDLLLACMGRVLPTSDRIGSVVILENTGNNRFSSHTVVRETHRVTDVQAGDFNGDGRLDLAVGKFGYYEGEVTWLENLGGWNFREHTLLNLPGTVNVLVADLDADGREDITALVSQQYEEIHLFSNQGGGAFKSHVIFGSTNEDYGSSGLSLCDVNRDGKPDLVYTNGDGFDYAEPGARPWHSIQWLENAGRGQFRHHHVANYAGAYSPVGADLNGDGYTDLVCVSGFNDWNDPRSVSLMAYLNDGRQNFTPTPLATIPTHLVTLAVADVDRDGRPELLSGGFHAYPPWDRMSRLLLWRQKARTSP